LLDALAVLAGSFVAGALGSAVGLVLGTLRLPLVLVLSGSPSAGAGTNVAISAAAAASGAASHARRGNVSWPVVAWMAPPSVAGAVVGSLFGHDVPERFLFAGIAVVLGWNGLDLLARPIKPRPRERLRVFPAIGLGFLIGVVGGALGVILGTLRMPALVRGVGLSARQAVGTNLVVGFLLGLFAFLVHALRLEVEWDLLAAGLAGALPGAWLGARLTGRMSEETLRRAIGLALLAIGTVFAVEAAVR
jgi:uncharacterized protein